MTFIVLYASHIDQAIKRNDRKELQELLEHARQTQREQGDLASAIQRLEQALGGTKQQ
jgi:hypothetical protein